MSHKDGKKQKCRAYGLCSISELLKFQSGGQLSHSLLTLTLRPSQVRPENLHFLNSQVRLIHLFQGPPFENHYSSASLLKNESSGASLLRSQSQLPIFYMHELSVQSSPSTPQYPGSVTQIIHLKNGTSSHMWKRVNEIKDIKCLEQCWYLACTWEYQLLLLLLSLTSYFSIYSPFVCVQICFLLLTCFFLSPYSPSCFEDILTQLPYTLSLP